jgi:hypothetical protein
MARKKREEDEQEFEQLVSQTELGVMRDYGDGNVYAGIAGSAGIVQLNRTPEGSISAAMIFEAKELWYANIVVFASGDKVIFDTKEMLGPCMTHNQIIEKAGRWAGEIMLKYVSEDDEED